MVLLGAVVLGPALAPGLVLSYDMVPVPDPSFTWAQLGLGAELPRAVPLDAITTAVTSVVPPELFQKLVLLGALAAAGCGAAALVGTAPMSVRLVAATVAIWNPYVAERLVIGHWGLLVAYGLLPWLVRSARSGAESSFAGRLLLLAGCAVTPTGGVLSLVVLVVVGTTGEAAVRRSLALPAAAWSLLNAPWWLPGLLHGSQAVSDPASVAAFAARAELPGGVLPTVLGLGGVWNAHVVPDSRGTGLAVAGLALLLVLVAAGTRAGLRADRRLTHTLLVLAGVGIAVALLGATPGLRDALGWVVAHVPGAGLLRDGQKFVALAMPAAAALAGYGTHAAISRLRDPVTAHSLLVGVLLLHVAMLPDLAWGAGGRLQAVTYPAAWADVRAAVARSSADGDLLLLPWSAFRSYAWNGRRIVLDPARRAFPAEVVADDRLVVGGRVLASEDARSAEVRRRLRAGRLDTSFLRRHGVRLVLVQRGQPSAAEPPTGLVELVRRPGLHLLRVPGEVRASTRPGGAAGTAAVVAVDMTAAAIVLGALVALARRRYLRIRGPAGPTRW